MSGILSFLGVAALVIVGLVLLFGGGNKST